MVLFWLIFSACMFIVSIYFFSIAFQRKKQIKSQQNNTDLRIRNDLTNSQKNQDKNEDDVPEDITTIPDSNSSLLNYDLFSQQLESIPKVDLILSDTIIKRRFIRDMPLITYTNITKKTNVDKLFPFVVLDVETTGLKITDDIIEVSAIKYDKNFTPVLCFTSLVKPKKPIPDRATEINHITNDMVEDAPYFYQIAPQLHDFISGCNIVGHNVEFDLKFLYAYGVDFDEKRRYYDTLELAHRTLKGPKRNYSYDSYCDFDFDYDDFSDDFSSFYDCDVNSFKLTDLCEYYLIGLRNSHRSLDDCYATGQLFENLVNDKMNK